MDLERLIRQQHGVLSRSQALSTLSDEQLRWRLDKGRWTTVHPGVYRDRAVDLDWLGRASAALLFYGPDAALALESAAFLLGINDKAPALVHVDVPHDNQRRRLTGVRRRRRRQITTVTRRGLRVTAPAQTIIDLGDVSGAVRDDVIAVAARAVQRRKTTAEQLGAELASRRTHRNRRALTLALALVGQGAESGLEVAFVTRVLRAHGLPEMRMAVPDTVGGRSIRRDFVDEARGLVVETDGALGHDAAGRREDNRRDRTTAARGGLTLRTDWVEVHFGACDLAADIADAQRSPGWGGTARPRAPRPV